MLTEKDLYRIYFLSGSVCSGKTSVSSILANRLNWNIYHCDDWREKHGKKADPKITPTFFKVSKLTGDDLWLRPLKEQIETDDVSGDEEFELAIEDLKECLENDERPIIFDGYVSPRKLLPLLASKNHAFYLVATEEFQLHHYKKREWIENVLSKTSDKELAWQNWMQRDLASARSLEKQAIETNLPWLSVDGSIDIEATVDLIAKHFEASTS